MSHLSPCCCHQPTGESLWSIHCMVQPVQHWESHTPPAMPRDCSCLSGYWSDSCLSRRGFEGICFILALTFTHLLIQGPPHNLPELCICRVASQVNVPEMMKRWLTSRGYALSLWRQENTLWGKGSQEILIKKIAKTRRNFLSQERLQALLYQDKELKLARSVITKAASLRTAKPDFQSRQVPIHLTCLCAGCTPANLSMDGPSQALEEQHLVHVSGEHWAQWAWHSHTCDQEPHSDFPILLQGCT